MHPKSTDKYLYVNKTPTWLVRIVFATGIFSWGLVIFGYANSIKIGSIYWWSIFPFLLFFSAYYFISYGINFFYKHPDLEQHRNLVRRFWKQKNYEPAVDIFLPICGEDVEVLRETFRAVTRLKYKNKKVYVLDDKGVGQHQDLALKMGFVYSSRENKGFMKKAGNLKHGFDQSSGEFVAVFDADFAPHPDFIKELLPYMSDPNIAIVQSPQYFQTDSQIHRQSKLQYGAAHIQEDFYRFIQVARDAFGVPICCGSNAIYRRAALESIGGTTQIEHSEDMYTGFELTLHGWRVKYVPIILAIGLCPDNLHPYFLQQHRWCSGNLALMLDPKFWKSKVLTLGQKICFISGFMYYLSYPVAILISFQAFFVLFRYGRYVSLINSAPFLPFIIFSFVILPLFRISRPMPGSFLARTASGYACCHAAAMAIVRKSVSWQPTNAKKMIASKAYMEALTFNAIYLFIYLALFGLLIERGYVQMFNLSYYSVLFWIFFNIFSTSIMLYNFSLVLYEMKVKLVDGSLVSIPKPNLIGGLKPPEFI